MELLWIDIAGPINEMAFKLAMFSLTVVFLYLIPFLITKLLFKNDEVANLISGLVLIGCLYFAFQNGIFFDWFFSFIYIH